MSQIDHQSPPPQDDYWANALRWLFSFDELHIHQKVLAIAQKYYVHDADNQPRFFVVRPPKLLLNTILSVFYLALRIIILVIAYRLFVSTASFLLPLLIVIFSQTFLGFMFALMAPYRHIEVFRDESQQWRILTITQDNKIGFYRRYTLYGQDGSEVAVMSRSVFASVFRRDWWVETPDGYFLCRVREDSLVRSLLRRYLGTLYGVLRTNFNFEDENGQVLGVYDRKLTLRDQYHLNMSDDPNHTIDRRVCLAMSILLDSAESR